MYLGHEFVVPSSGVVYLGHVNANVKAKGEGDLPASAIAPLADQAVSGAYTGSFDVRISDRASLDLPEFRNRFPSLRSVQIQKAILPAYDVNKARTLWDDQPLPPDASPASPAALAPTTGAPVAPKAARQAPPPSRSARKAKAVK